MCVDANDNELSYLEAIHFFVEVLDSFFGNVCELDLVFNFYKVRFSSFHWEGFWWMGMGMGEGSRVREGEGREVGDMSVIRANGSSL